MRCCPNTVPRAKPVTSISSHARLCTVARVVSCRFSKKSRPNTPNDWNVSAATCSPPSNRRAQNSATLESHWIKNWASHGYATSNCCCTSAVFAWKNWNQVSSVRWLRDATRRFNWVRFLMTETHAESITLALYLHTLVSFTSPNTWAILKQKAMAPLKPGMTQLCSNIMGSLVQKGFFLSLRVSSLASAATIRCLKNLLAHFRWFCWREPAARRSHSSPYHSKRFYRCPCDHWYLPTFPKIWCRCLSCTFYRCRHWFIKWNHLWPIAFKRCSRTRYSSEHLKFWKRNNRWRSL